MSEEVYLDQEEPKKFPAFLKVLLILTTISVSLATLSILSSLISGQPSSDQIERANVGILKQAAQMEEQHLTGMAEMLRKTAEFTEFQQINFWPTFGLNLITTLTGIFAVMYMRRLRKLGYYFYILYNVIGIFGLYLFIPASIIPLYVVVTGVILSSIFVLLYTLNLKHLK